MRNSLIITAFIIFVSAVSINAGYLDDLVDRVTKKIEKKTDEIVDKKTDEYLETDDKNNTVNQESTADDEPQTSGTDKISKLKELIKMKENGYLTDEEFEEQKAILLSE